MITSGLCVHVDPLFGEKEAIFKDILCALRLKYGKSALQYTAGFGWPRWRGKQKLVSEVTALQTREAFLPAYGVWKSRVRCRSAGEVRRRRDSWEALMEDLRKDRLRLVWRHDHTHHKAYIYQNKALSID